jgi:hypothetical protein
MKEHNTIYVRPSRRHPDYKYEAFGKTRRLKERVLSLEELRGKMPYKPLAKYFGQ